MQAIKEVLSGNINSGSQVASSADLKDMTVLVTGATGGIGLEVAKALANSGARVLLLSRKRENGDRAVSEIKNAVQSAVKTMQNGENGQTNQGSPMGGKEQRKVDVEFIPCDLGNLREVKEVADKIAKQEKRLDILVAGAGIGVNKFDEDSDGIDRHFGVNHLGHFLLVNRLLPLMVQTTNFPSLNAPHPRPARIVSISSELHRTAPGSIKFASIQEVASLDSSKEANESKDLSANSLYARTKLANILFTRMLVDKVIRPNGYEIIAMATHPGAVHTGQQDQFKEAYGDLLGSVMKAVTVPFMKNPDEGSASTVWAAVSNDVVSEKDTWQGAYVTNPGEKSGPTSQAMNDELAKNLWKLSEALIEKKLGKDGLMSWDGLKEVNPS